MSYNLKKEYMDLKGKLAERLGRKAKGLSRCLAI
jgi:hypothetical protein